jgi:hypothetical protein
MASQKDIDDSKKTIDKLDKAAEKQLAKLDGGKITTEAEAKAEVLGNWKEYTLGKATLKIEGGYTRVQVGPSETVVYGLKGEYVTPVSIAYILGIEKKTVVGLAQTRIDGAKSDDIGGAKVDNLLGIKYEKKAEKESKVGPSPGLRNEIVANDKMNSLKEKFGTWGGKFVNWLYKVDENKEQIGSLKTDVANMTKSIQNCSEAAARYEAKVKAYKEDCKTKAEVKASEITYDCSGGFQARGSGSMLNMFPSSQCILKGGGGKVICGSSYVTVTGPKVWFGKSF